MRHRSYRGKMIYCTHGVGEMGREWFSVTIQPDGTRTLRAQCEMDDDRLLRDVVLTVDAHWHPVDAFVRLAIEEQTVGSTWYCFEAGRATCEGRTRTHGRLSREINTRGPIECFGTHALHGDAWVLGRFRDWTGPPAEFAFVDFACSTLANGGSGPDLIAVPSGFATVHDLGNEQTEVAAGRFETRHLRICVPGVDDFDLWIGGEDCLPVRLTSDHLHQTYELESLEGDWR